MDQSRIWNFIKYLAFVIIAVVVVILLGQFIKLSKLERKNRELLLEQTKLEQNLTDLQQQKTNLDDNYSQFATDKAKEEYDMKSNDEEVIVAK